MCMFGSAPTPEAPPLPVEYAAQRAPSTAAAQDAGTSTRDRLRAATPTVLTGANGVGAVDTTGKKTLLGA